MQSNCTLIFHPFQSISTAYPCTPADNDPVLLRDVNVEVKLFWKCKGLFETYIQYRQSKSGGRNKKKK